MILTPDQQRVKLLLAETITLLCKNGLTFNSVFSIEALVGITLDNSRVILLNINETISKDDKHTNELSVKRNSINNIALQRDETRKRHKPIPLDDGDKSDLSIKIAEQTAERDRVEGVAVGVDNTDDISEQSEMDGLKSNDQRRYMKKNWNNSSQECVSDINPRSTQSASDENEQTVITRDVDRNSDLNRARLKRNLHKNDTGVDAFDPMEPELLDSDRTSDTKHSETFSEPALKRETEKSFSDAIEIKQEVDNENESATDYYNYYSSTDAPGSSQAFRPEYGFPSSNDSFAGSSGYEFDPRLDFSKAYKRKPWNERRSFAAPNHSNKRPRIKQQSSTFFDNDVDTFSVAQQNSTASAGDWSMPASLAEDGTSELIIRCRECLKIFPTIQAYLSHLSVHRKRASSGHGRSGTDGSGEKEVFYKYPCPCCDMTFSGHTNFRGHWSKHSGIKEFVCGVCGLRYAYKQMLKDHMLQHHPPSAWLNS